MSNVVSVSCSAILESNQVHHAVAYFFAEYVTAGTNRPVMTPFGFLVEDSNQNDSWWTNYNGGQFLDDFAEESCLQYASIQQISFPQELFLTKKEVGSNAVWGDQSLYIQSSVERPSYEVTDASTLEKRILFSPLVEAVIDGNVTTKAEEKIVVDPSAQPIRFVILQKETALNFVAGVYSAPAGSVLYENPDDVDGYTVVGLVGFLQDYVPVYPEKMLQAA